MSQENKSAFVLVLFGSSQSYLQRLRVGRSRLWAVDKWPSGYQYRKKIAGGQIGPPAKTIHEVPADLAAERKTGHNPSPVTYTPAVITDILPKEKRLSARKEYLSNHGG